ncbi:MAG TPA: hypothetical protein VE544_13405 [Nitrososphaeraceae archaeon]|nr:hypothetical protein [Nitrososphaeraceae archaeon]
MTTFNFTIEVAFDANVLLDAAAVVTAPDRFVPPMSLRVIMLVLAMTFCTLKVVVIKTDPTNIPLIHRGSNVDSR